MKKKVTKLTLEEQGALIRAAISQAKVNSNKLRETIANYKSQHSSCHIENAPSQDNTISQYVGTTFNFYGFTPLGIPVHVLFTLDNRFKLLRSNFVNCLKNTREK